MSLNPNRQVTVGVEYAPTVTALASLSTTPSPSALLTATVTENIATISPYLLVPASGRHQAENAATLVFDIYDATDPTGPPKVRPVTYYSDAPVSDGPRSAGTGMWLTEGGIDPVASAWQHLDDDPDSPTMTDYIDYTYAGTVDHGIRFKASPTLKVGGVTTATTGQRIAAVHVKVVMANRSTRYGSTVWAVLGMDNGGGVTEQAATAYSLPKNTLRTITWSFRTNPVTGLPWTLADLAQFQTGGAGDFGLRMQSGLDGAPLRLYALELEVATVLETRLAWAYTTQNPTDPSGFRPFPVRNVATGATQNWAKTTGRTYLISGWQPSGGIGYAWRCLDGDTLAGLTSVNMPISTGGNGVPTGPIPTPLTRAPTFTLTVAGGATLSVDSQPYAQVAPEPVSASLTVAQELGDLAAGVPYGLYSVALLPHATSPTGPLSILVADLSAAGTPTVAGPATLDPSAFDTTQAVRWHAAFEAPFTPTAGHRYIVALTSTTGSAAPWNVIGLDTLDDAAAVVGYRGTTDVAVIGGLTRDLSQDLAITLQRVPALLGSPTAALYRRTLPAAAAGCSVPYHNAAVIDWAAADPGGPFGYYEVQRSDDASGYQTIARLTDVASTAFYDFESRRDVAATYRVRQVRADGAISAWTLPVAVVVPATDSGGLLLVTNVAPDLCLGYTPDGGQHAYTFNDAQTVTLHPIFGRDLYIESRPLERRGDTVSRTLVLQFGKAATVIGRQAFQPLLDLVTAPLPYVCVLDDDGTRWYASVTVGQGLREEPVGRYTVTAAWTDLTYTPAPPTVAWVP